jgi:quinohemoprotein amine dehydrogenase
VLLLSEDWSTFEGRLFTGEYNEIGFDVRLFRRNGATAIRAVENAAVRVPSTGHELFVTGEGFPEGLTAADFHLGEGVKVTRVERQSAERVLVAVDVSRKARQGPREISFRAVRGPREVVLYDTIDYLQVTPKEGLARTGGKLRPPQIERFEAIAMNRGADDELYTADDFAIRPVKAEWTLAEFPVRENDDDAQFVGSLDAATGVFTPALDGPNPARRWEANNIGEVFVIARAKLDVQQIERKPKSKRGVPPPTPVPEDAPVVMVEREFVARGHLLVMVPLYVQWDRYAWDKR